MTLLVSIALMGMNFFLVFTSQMYDIGKGDYTLQHAFIYVIMTMPYDYYQIFPIAGLLGCMLGLGLLASHSELIILRASGMSVRRITAVTLGIILLLVLAVTYLGEQIAPHLLYKADVMRTMDKNNGQAVATKNGVWLREGNNFIHVNNVYRHGEMEGITRFIFDSERQLKETVWADKASYNEGKWQLKNVRKSYIYPDHVDSETAAQMEWSVHLSPGILRVAQSEPEEMSLHKLYSVMQYKKTNKLEYVGYALPFWQRILQPLATCVMMFLAIPFIFGPLRNVSMGLRILAGLTLGFSFYFLNQFFVPFSMVYQFPPFVAAIFPTLLFSMLGFILMKRVR